MEIGNLFVAVMEVDSVALVVGNPSAVEGALVRAV